MYTHILIATDGSDLAKKGVDHGISLAKETNAKVTLVAVTEPFPIHAVPSEGSFAARNAIEVYNERCEKSAGAILDAAHNQAAQWGVACEKVHVPDSRAADGILATAREKGCNLIVMTSHGRRGLGRLLLGSQTVEVLTHSPVPVLVVK
ncbi:universal stress protein [Aureimonas populi]|uniref:Universal stress protein n=1 Tax=Aureimonas populi TaxID=1701758 RepID=A0ABW5CIK4_9HYPH|nr:universal stress protein [Aureimonas populi]